MGSRASSAPLMSSSAPWSAWSDLVMHIAREQGRARIDAEGRDLSPNLRMTGDGSRIYTARNALC